MSLNFPVLDSPLLLLVFADFSRLYQGIKIRICIWGRRALPCGPVDCGERPWGIMADDAVAEQRSVMSGLPLTLVPVRLTGRNYLRPFVESRTRTVEPSPFPTADRPCFETLATVFQPPGEISQ